MFPSAWVEQPDTRTLRLQDLARRYALHIVNANWAAGVVRVPGKGGSCVIAPDGTLVACASPAGRIDVTL